MELNAIKTISERIGTQLLYEIQTATVEDFDKFSWQNQQGIVISLKEATIINNTLKEFENLINVLEEISEGKGRYNQDQLIHAANTVEDLVKLAKDALLKIQMTNRLNRKSQSLPVIIDTLP